MPLVLSVWSVYVFFTWYQDTVRLRMQFMAGKTVLRNVVKGIENNVFRPIDSATYCKLWSVSVLQPFLVFGHATSSERTKN